MKIGVIDSGLGNVGSVLNMIKKIGYHSIKISKTTDFQNVDKIIIPGVGSFDSGIQKLQEKDFISILLDQANEGKHILGICLGMQMLASSSEEGLKEGLNLIPGVVKKFPSSINLPIPHMGWNSVEFKSPQISKNLNNNKFYFVHSFYYQTKVEKCSIGKTSYGIKFSSCVNKDNIFGVQFHLEKSHKYGMQLFRNFVELPL